MNDEREHYEREHLHSELKSKQSDLRSWAEHRSDRTVGVAVLSASVVLLIGLIALFSSLLNSFLGGTTLLAVVASVAALIVGALARR
jgi:hypothetical protein